MSRLQELVELKSGVRARVWIAYGYSDMHIGEALRGIWRGGRRGGGDKMWGSL